MLVADLASEGLSTECCQLDLRDSERFEDLTARCGPEMHTLVYAAASAVNRPLASLRAKHVDWTLDVNAKAFVLLLGHALPTLAKTQGSIVALTSAGSRRVFPNYALVGISKAALEAAVRYAAVEAAPLGVRVNSVSAGIVETKALTSFPDAGNWFRSVAKSNPLGRLVAPDDVADAVLWLSSPGAAMVTGHTLVVDGGLELVQVINEG